MGDSAHLLEASITSALALKPSTVYVVRVENRASHAKWHLRKCFSEFSELREKVIGLIESTAGAAAAAGKNSFSSSTCSASSPAPSLSLSSNCSSAFDTGSSHTSRSSSVSSDATLTIETSASFSERFPYLFKQFPRRQLFGSRSRKVIEQRTRALNAFVHQLLLYAREVRQQNQIAIYFGLRGFVEAFFECAEHSTSFFDATAKSNCFPFAGLNSPSTLAKTQAAAAAAARAAAVGVVGAHGTQRRPAHALFAFSGDSESDDDEDDDAAHKGVAPASAANFHFTRRFYQEYGKAAVSSDSDDDDDESKLVGLKKASSTIAHRELREMKVHFTSSHYAPLQTASVASAPDTWAARIEIAGIPAIVNRSQQRQPHPSSSTLAISANRVQRQQLSSGSHKKRADVDEARRWQTDEAQAASILYAVPKPESSTSASSRSMAKTLFSKEAPSSRHALRRAAVAAREERPEWA